MQDPHQIHSMAILVEDTPERNGIFYAHDKNGDEIVMCKIVNVPEEMKYVQRLFECATEENINNPSYVYAKQGNLRYFAITVEEDSTVEAYSSKGIAIAAEASKKRAPIYV